MSKIQKAILKSINEFYSSDWSQNDFLTEDDVRCRLFAKLETIVRNHKHLALHSEVRWYGRNNDLKYRSDLVVLDQRNLSVNPIKLPSKGYSFNRYYCIIEIKLRRPNNDSSDYKYDTSIVSDLEKLFRISEETGGEHDSSKCFVLIAFDKKRQKKFLRVNHFEPVIQWQDW